MVDNDDISLLSGRVEGLDILIFFVDRSDKFECDLVLEIDSEIGEKEYAFLDYFDVGLQDEIFLHC